MEQTTEVKQQQRNKIGRPRHAERTQVYTLSLPQSVANELERRAGETGGTVQHVIREMISDKVNVFSL